MIVNWISSKEVVSRVMRNIKGVQAEYMDDILEWIPEALLKMKTQYSVSSRAYILPIVNHQAIIPTRIEGLLGVTYKGHRLQYNDKGNMIPHHPSSAGYSLFQSNIPINGPMTNIQYSSSGDVIPAATNSAFPRDSVDMYKDDTDSQPVDGYTDPNVLGYVNNPFPRDTGVPPSLQDLDLPWHPNAWYKINGKFLQTSLKYGEVKVWVQELPVDEESYPFIPDMELVKEAIYRYCRMMLIEAGFEDKVFSHDKAYLAWENAADRAITAMSFPTPDQVESSIHRHLDNFFPDGLESANSGYY